MKNCYLSLLILIIFSCNNDAGIATYKVISADLVEERSVGQIQLKGENFGPVGEFGQLLDIALVNATIVVQDKKNDYAFFGLKDEGSLIPFQSTGDGPEQVDNPDIIKLVSFDASSNEIYFFDFSAKTVNSVEIQPDSVFKKSSTIPGLYWREIQSAVNLNDSLVAVTGFFSDTKFIVFNQKTQKEVTRSDYVNSFTNELTAESRVEVASVDIKYNAKHDFVILSNGNVNSIDTYSVNGERNKFYSFGEFKNITPENEFSLDYFYYYSVKTQGDVVYGLYLGVENSMIALQDLFLSSARPELHVFNLLTDELLRLRLDRVVNACVLDTDKNVIYCIEENNEDQPLVKYEIPEIL